MKYTVGMNFPPCGPGSQVTILRLSLVSVMGRRKFLVSIGEKIFTGFDNGGRNFTGEIIGELVLLTGVRNGSEL